MIMRRSAYFLIFLVLLGLFGIIKSLTFQYVEAITLPLMMSSVIFTLAATELARELRSKDRAQIAIEAKAQGEVEARAAWRRFGSTVGWVIGFSLGIYLVGFLIATPLFVGSYLKRQGQGWLTAIIFAILTVAFIYGVFELALKARLYVGLIFGGRW